MPKEKKAGKGKRSCPLERQLAYDARSQLKQKSLSKDVLSDGEDDLEQYVDTKMTQKTLALAKAQQAEEEDAMEIVDEPVSNPAPEDMDSSDEEMSEDDMVRINEDEGYVEHVEISEMDEAILENFMDGGFGERRNLADIIMEKIYEKEAIERGEIDPNQPRMTEKFDPKIVQVYTGVGALLKRYKSGKLPKAFKVIPSLSYWEDILWMTRPEEWSAHAMFAATKLFASNLNPKMAQRFYNIFLLEHVRQDIREHKRLNYHLYMALKKALYKPQAFFRGIILPLCEGRECTLREAQIIGSVLSKVSIPVIHSAASLLKLAEMSYSGGNSIFIRVLLDKKYSLPTRVINQLCVHFLQFINDSRKLPVLWHQALLVFAQRYKNNIPKDAKEQMKQLFKVHFHHQITPEIRRELFSE